MKTFKAYVGLDVHKETITVAIADGRSSDVRFYGTIKNTPDAVAAMIKKLGDRHKRLHFVYEAGPCGYGLYRQINAAAHVYEVVSPAHTPRRAGDRVKTDRRDAIMLARLARAGELTSVWVPDETHEAMRDLIRAREVAVEARKNALAFVTAIRERRNGLRRGRTKERGGGQGVRAGPGNPPRNSASGDPDLRGSDRGSPTTKNWHAVPNPRMRNCSTVVIAPAP